MGKQTKSKKTDKFGKGKVTPVQIAFIVDRYLSDNNYHQTRSTFRTEASDLLSKSPVQEAPKSLLSLGAMLDEYICLKEQKVMLDQDKHRLEHEKIRVQMLLRGMQDVMNAYNAPPPSMVLSTAPQSVAMVPRLDSPAGHPSFSTPVMMSVSKPSKTHMDPRNFNTPVPKPMSRRRKGSNTVPDGHVPSKKSRRHLTTHQLPVIGPNTFPQPITAASNQENSQQFSAVQSSPHDDVPGASPVQGSSVAKCLFNQASQSPPTNLSDPVTPLKATSSPTEKSVSPLTGTPSNNVAGHHIISSNRTVITSESITVSPAKQIAYYSIERNHRISSSSPVKTNLSRLAKRDHVKGRLDFDGSDMPVNSEKPITDEISASQSNQDMDIFDFNLDALGTDFSLSELLADFDLHGVGIKDSCQPTLGSPDSLSGSQSESGDANLGANQVLSEFSSTVTEIISEKDMNLQGGPDSVTNVKSITKCIKILSPAKNQTRSPSARS